jgi:hypothetical protein
MNANGRERKVPEANRKGREGMRQGRKIFLPVITFALLACALCPLFSGF